MNQEPNKDANPNAEDLANRLETFKEEIKEHRKALHDGKDFSAVEEDAEYRLLLVQSDLTQGDEELRQSIEWYRLQSLEQQRKADEKEEKKTGKKKKKKVVHVSKGNDNSDKPIDKIGKQRVIAQKRNYQEEAMNLLKKQRRDLELLIGEKGTTVIGSLILTISIIVLIRHGISEGYISKEMRVFIGSFVASLFAGIGFYFRKKEGFASPMAFIASLGILYYTSYLTQHSYHFVDPQTAFYLNIAILLASVRLVFAYQRKEILWWSFVSFYAIPILTGISSLHHDVLFVYASVFNLVFLGINYRFRWQFIITPLFVASLLIFGVWVVRNPIGMEGFFESGFSFTIFFFLTFFGVNMISALRDSFKVKSLEYLIFWINTAFFYLTMYQFLQEGNLLVEHFGSFNMVFGGFYAFFALIVFQNQYADRNIGNYLQMIAVSMLVLVAPVSLLERSQLNIYWATQSVLFLVLTQRYGMKYFRDAVPVTMVLSLAMLLHDWLTTYSGGFQNFFFNDAVLASAITMISMIASIYFLLKDQKSEILLGVSVESYTSILGGTIIITIWLIGNIELNYHTLLSPSFARLLVGIFNSAFFILLWLFGKRTNITRLHNISDIMMWVIIGSYIIYGHYNTLELRDQHLINGGDSLPFMIHYVNILLVLIAMVLFGKDIFRRFGEESGYFKNLIRYISIILVFYASIELENLILFLTYETGDDMVKLLRNTHRVGFAILWAMMAFGMMLAGVKTKIKIFRVNALALFAFILVKFFVWDFWKLKFEYQLASSLLLGVLMLIIARLYRRLLDIVDKGEIPAKNLTEAEEKSIESTE
ncbi:MAG: DUF2339 domain-containing protein [Bacteroidetes bacterium]|nr:MAG: DUF2339 domain-containing protein [Bacteroidota bacterium]